MSHVNVLGIETSCDETAASVVRDGKVILSNTVVTSLKKHQKYGGIIPEIASRHQLELISSIVDLSLKEAKVKLKDISYVSVTRDPGLIGSLLVGISFARALSFGLKKPLIEVDHIKAHLYANFLFPKDKRLTPKQIKSRSPHLPAVGLIVSGGHTSLFHLKSINTMELLGQTRDDAAGEAFDKVARILELGYPGGPFIDKMAKNGQNRDIKFTGAEIPDSFDFSFSGIKTAVLYYVRNQTKKNNILLNKIAYSFQNSVVETLVKKSIGACLRKKVKTLLVGGGEAANSMLRSRISKEAEKHNIRVFFPPLDLCLDNAAMIAGLGYHLRN